MRRNSENQQAELEDAPKLVPAGSVNRVLLLGGKNLTRCQSIGLTLIGLCLGIGGVAVASMFGFEAGDMSYAFYLQFFACAMALWGLVMIVNGILGIARRLIR